MTDDEGFTWGFINEVLDVLERHGYRRSDDEHAGRAIGLIGDLARIYDGAQDRSARRLRRGTVRPADGNQPTRRTASSSPPIRSRLLLAALDDAAEDKRDRANTCTDCADQSCTTCQWRLHAADAYDQLASQMIQATDTSATRQHEPGHAAAPTRRPDSDPPPASPGRAHGQPGTAGDAMKRRKDSEPSRDPRHPAPRLRDRRQRQQLGQGALPGRREPTSGTPCTPARTPNPTPNPTWKPNHNPTRKASHDPDHQRHLHDQRPTAHTARHSPDRNGWEVSWLPGQILDRNTAITAMILADTAAEHDLHEGHRLWPHIQSWAEELGLTAHERSPRYPSRPTT